MISADQEREILHQAYVPEHLVGLMTLVSGAEPFLYEDYFCCCKGDWTVFVGYPLSRDFSVDRFADSLKAVLKRFRPSLLAVIAPELPSQLPGRCREKGTDHYYTLDLRGPGPKQRLERIAARAREVLTVERSSVVGNAHAELTREFLERASPHPRVRELFLRMPQYVRGSDKALVLNAWDHNRALAAYYVVDLSADDFTTYVVGCHSRENYVQGASDLLFSELVCVSRELGKKYIHLGLGVNKGITQFKKKWGGAPSLRYEMCELHMSSHWILDAIMTCIRPK